ncbi:MAG: cell division protein FtsZ, partial [Burkholderiaceae bacterium]|nr:cell division protein FtsZ [Burkholderiaceae bacterium]
LGDQLRVTVIATGLSSAKRAEAPISVVRSAPVLQRTGTDNLPVLNQVVNAGAAHSSTPPPHDYAGLSTPSVWRNRGTAAAKVDALANNGMDEIEIPAFLRKQAD